MKAYQERGDDGEESTESQHDGVPNALRQQRLAAEKTRLASAHAIDDGVVLRPGQASRTRHGDQTLQSLTVSDHRAVIPVATGGE